MTENKLIIHVGTPKTGSSFLQSSFREKGEDLKKFGILYPGIKGLEYSDTSNVDINGQLLTRIFRLSSVEEYYLRKKEIHSLVVSLFSFGFNKVFISDETLGVLPTSAIDLIRSVCREADINLVLFAYFRVPNSYYPSHWSQVVRKHGEIRGLIDFSSEMHLPVWQNLIDIESQKEECHLFSYEKVVEEQALLKSALGVMGVDSEKLFEGIDINKQVNTALSLRALTAIRFINEEYGQELGTKVNDILTDNSVIKFSGKASLPNEISDLVLDKHRVEYDTCMELFQKSKYLYMRKE